MKPNSRLSQILMRASHFAMVSMILLLSGAYTHGQALWNGLNPQQTAASRLQIRVSDGDLTSILGTAKFSATNIQLTASATNYVYLDLTQSPPKLTVNTTGFPSTSYYPIATVVTSTSQITSLTDSRPTFNTAIGSSGSGTTTSTAVFYNQAVDSFGRTAGNLGSNWTNYLNGLSVTPGTVIGTTASQLNVAAYTGQSSVPTQTVRVSIRSLNGTTDSIGPAVRISGTVGTSVSFYTCVEESTTMILEKIVGASNSSVGTVTSLASTSITGTAGDYLTLSDIGNTLTCVRNTGAANTFLQVNDASSPLTSGAPGIAMYNDVATLSQFTFMSAGSPSGALENIVFDGDSIIAANGNGSTGTDPATSYLYLPTTPAYVTNLGVPSKCLGVTCAATNSGNIESMLTTGTSVVDTLYNSTSGVKNICVIFAGTNDIYTASRTPTQVYTDLTTYITARHSVGWKVVVVPALSRIATSGVATDSSEAQYSALIQANTAGADAVVTLPIYLIGVGASQNTILFNTDQVHPTEITHIEILARALNATLSKF
jgi:hypothetical protein